MFFSEARTNPKSFFCTDAERNRWIRFSLPVFSQAQIFFSCSLYFPSQKQHNTFISLLEPRPPQMPPPHLSQTVFLLLLSRTLPCSLYLHSTTWPSQRLPIRLFLQNKSSASLLFLRFSFSSSSHLSPIALHSFLFSAAFHFSSHTLLRIPYTANKYRGVTVWFAYTTYF